MLELGAQTVIVYRRFTASDSTAVNAIAFAAFSEYQDNYDDWSTRQRHFKTAATLAASGEMVVAEADGQLVGAVTYCAPDPHRRYDRPTYFNDDWAVMRMLVVDPSAQGKGIGRGLSQACVAHAKRDAARILALHTSPMMKVALPMYLRMGFQQVQTLAPMGGVAFGLYTLKCTSKNPTFTLAFSE